MDDKLAGEFFEYYKEQKVGYCLSYSNKDSFKIKKVSDVADNEELVIKVEELIDIFGNNNEAAHSRILSDIGECLYNHRFDEVLEQTVR